jgi:hypothetical protein
MTDQAADLGENITVLSEPEAPPTAEKTPPLVYVMAAREQYLSVGWTDEQLIATGKMEFIQMPPEEAKLISVGMPERIWIQLEESDEIPPTGQFVGHNGIGYMLTTGAPLPVPYFVLDILDQAIVSTPVLDPNTRKVTGWRTRRRFNYRKVDAPVEETAEAA